MAKVKGKIQKNKVEDIKKGIIDSGDFLKCEDIKIIFESTYNSTLEITMIKGKKHEVKRLIKYIEVFLLNLKRISHGQIALA